MLLDINRDTILTPGADYEQWGDWAFAKTKVKWTELVAKFGEEEARRRVCYPGPRHGGDVCAWQVTVVPRAQRTRDQSSSVGLFQEIEGFPGGSHGSLVNEELYPCRLCSAQPGTPCPHPHARAPDTKDAPVEPKK